ncbi:MAG: hypothetical protein Ct9H300mP16_15810 [Pseudomonadota bacterium]|nr:MAG: hypothetical protein Ct9H300mP16_15810 [Pseudomonadota bacterium]
MVQRENNPHIEMGHVAPHRGVNFSFGTNRISNRRSVGRIQTISIADRTLATMNLAEGYLRK